MRTVHGPGVAIAAWTTAGLALGLALGAWTVRVNGSIYAYRDALVFALWCGLAYALVFAAAGTCAAGIERALRRAPAPARAFHAHVALAWIAWLAYGAGSRLATAQWGWATEVDRRAMLGGAAAALAALALGAVLAARTGLARALGALRAGVLAIAALLATPLLAWLALPAARPPGDAAARAAMPAAAASAERPERVVLVGLDGADLRLARELAGAGRLPHWSALFDEGVAAPLTSQIPTWSPILWNTFATGVAGSLHGILDFTAIELPGMRRGVQRLRVVERLALQADPSRAPVPAHTGLAPLAYAAVELGWLAEVPIQGFHRRVKALHNVLSDAGRRVAVVRWWASWPAEEVLGFVVSDANVRKQALSAASGRPALAGATYPPELLAELAALDDPELGRCAGPQTAWDRADPAASRERALALPLFEDLGAAQRAALAADEGLLELVWNAWADDRFGVACAAHLAAREPLDYLAVYTSLIDVLGHRLEQHVLRDPGYLAVVERAYEESDRLLGRLLGERRPGTTYVLVSDHGWSYERGRYGHYDAPAGVIVLAGDGVRSGARLAAQPTSFDVAPTVLALLGLPASLEQPGEALVDVLRADRAEPARVQSFGRYAPRYPGAGAAAAGAGSREALEELERLRALGYVQ